MYKCIFCDIQMYMNVQCIELGFATLQTLNDQKLIISVKAKISFLLVKEQFFLFNKQQCHE